MKYDLIFPITSISKMSQQKAGGFCYVLIKLSCSRHVFTQ